MPAARMVQIRSSHVLALALLVVILVLGSATAAFAGTVTNWRGLQPSGTTGSLPIIATGSGVGDGKPLVAASLKLYVDGVLIPRPLYTASVLSTYVYVYYNPVPALADGAHTYRIEVSDSAAKLSTKQWSSTLAQPPTALWLSPTAGSTVYSGRPRIVMSFADNTPSTTFAVIGQVRIGSSTGPVAATFGSSGLNAGSNTFAISHELVFGTHYLTATVTDAAGNSRVLSGTTARAFTSVSAPAMTVLESCDSCHSATRASHPTPAQTDCGVCHADKVDDHMEGTDYCEDCHWDGWHKLGGLTVTVTGSCVSCHSTSRPDVVQHTASSTSVAHESSCGGCHYGTLISTHSATPVGSSYAYQCDMCHGSTEAAVQAAIMTENTTCSACHLDGFHADFVTKHAFTGMDTSCQASGCHTATLVDAHAGFVGAEGRYPQYPDTCALCHQNADSLRVPEGATADCSSCHASADHESFHATTVAPACAGCHSAASLTSLHINPDTTMTCGTCHESQDPEVEAAIAADNLACSACHTAQGTDYHVDFDANHTYAEMDTSCQTEGCHANTLDDAHVAYVGDGNRYPQYTDTCSLCHSNPDAERIPADATAACASCHGESHGDIGVIHAATMTSTNVSILGTDFGTHACSECHASTDLRDLHGGTSSCGTCHPTPANTAMPWDRGCVQGGCHTVTSSAPQHQSLDTAHATTPKTCTTTAGCHSGGTNIAAIHQEQGCAACHSTGVTPSADCATCHDLGSPHGDDRAIHATTVTAGDVKLFDYHEGYAALSWRLDCNLCHESANLLDAHSGDCASCHSGPRGTFTTWNKTCQQGGCHVTFHEEAVPAHENEYNTNDCETNCHNYDWSVPLENCGFCHTFVDRAPPVTQSDAKSSYIGPARITLTSHDPFPGSVAHTYFTIDGGTQTEGSIVDVAAPAAGTENHSVTFWSVDAAGHAEVAQTVSFTVAADTEPPSTTSNAQTAYIGPARIQLTPTDNGTRGVKATYYRLNGGSVTAGTVIVVPQPASGTQTHSLVWWSEDYAGNVEEQKTADFTVTSDTTAPTGSISIREGATYTQTQYVPLTLSASDDGGSGVSQMRFSNNNSTWSTWEAYATSKSSWTLTSGNGAKTVWVQYRDTAGNVSTYSDGIVFDSVAPTGSISINDGAASTTTSDVTLTLSATDALSGVSDMRFSTNGSTWSSWEPYSTSKAFALAAGNGTRYAYVQFRDSAGNYRQYSDTITAAISDTIAPTGSILINDGAAETNTTAVTLGLSAIDTGGSGLSQMRFSNNNVTWSAWETYATTKGWTLTPGNGVKTVYVQYRDGLLNVSATYSDTITLATSDTGSTLLFTWHPGGWAEAHLKVTSSSGVTITDTWVSGTGTDLDLYVTVPAGDNYYMECVYYYDEDWDDEGGPYGIWTSNPTINPDGVLSEGETVTWHY